MAADGNCSGHGANGPGCFVCPGVDCGQPVAVARISLDSVVCRCVLPWLWWKSLDFRHGDQLLQDRAGPGRTAYGNGASGCDWQRVHQSLLHANQREWSCPVIVDILILEKKEVPYVTNTITLSERISPKNH